MRCTSDAHPNRTGTVLHPTPRLTISALMNNGRLMIVDTPQGVKTLMRGSILEVVCDSVRRASGALVGSPGVTAVQTFGDRLHVILEDERSAPGVTEKLRSEGIAVTGSRIVAPTLENVFISLTTAAAGENARG